MTYRWEKQANGLFTVKDVSIFAKCERGGFTYDEKWLKDAAKFHRRCEDNGNCPQVIVKHNRYEGPEKEPEDAIGLVGNVRYRDQIRVEDRKAPGLVADLRDLTEEDKDRIVQGRLGGRSVEILKPKTGKPRIDVLAMLGRTPAYHRLAQGSEEHQFQAYGVGEDEGQRIFFMMDQPPQQPAAPAPAPAPAAPAQPNPAAILQQIMQLCQQAMGGQQAPAAPQPPAAKPAPAAPPQATARMQDEPEDPQVFEEPQVTTEKDTQIELLQARLAEVTKERDAALEAQFAASKEAEESAKETEEVSEKARIAQKFQALREEGAVFSDDVQQSIIDKGGFEFWESVIAPTLPRAPLAPKGGFVPAPVEGELPDQFNALKGGLRAVALTANQEYEAESDVFAADEITREAYITMALHQAKQGV